MKNDAGVPKSISKSFFSIKTLFLEQPGILQKGSTPRYRYWASYYCCFMVKVKKQKQSVVGVFHAKKDKYDQTDHNSI
jgi:hypothetical protein